MTKSITGAVAQIQTLAGALEGMRAAPSQPPEQLNVFPFALSYIGQCEVVKPSATLTIHIYTIVTEIHVARKDLPRDVAKLDSYPTLFPDAVWEDPTLDGAVDTVMSCQGNITPMVYGGIETLAWAFQTRVKIT